MAGPIIYTIGHSNHSSSYFVELVRGFDIEAVADVRSVPRSAHSAHFDRSNLQGELLRNDVRYVFMGLELGGRPARRDYYDTGGRVRYDLLIEDAAFKSGVQRLINGARQYRVAIMCSEEDPTACHRRLLVGRAIRATGGEIAHIRGDGKVVTDEGLLHGDGPDQGILIGEDTLPWRSIRSVSRSAQPNHSLLH